MRLPLTRRSRLIKIIVGGLLLFTILYIIITIRFGTKIIDLPYWKKLEDTQQVN